jgi:hypothetical protein
MTEDWILRHEQPILIPYDYVFPGNWPCIDCGGKMGGHMGDPLVAYRDLRTGVITGGLCIHHSKHLAEINERIKNVPKGLESLRDFKGSKTFWLIILNEFRKSIPHNILHQWTVGQLIYFARQDIQHLNDCDGRHLL